jgi:NAD(P)-dependent dehydrogenase (short-subunit alcohol dehydrogenase family)
VAAKAIRKYGAIDVLVSTVGVVLELLLEDIDEKEWNWIWSLNVMTQVTAVNVFLPYLRKSSNARRLLTVSGGGFVAPDQALKIGAYSTTKHALVGYAPGSQQAARDARSSRAVGFTFWSSGTPRRP